MGSVRALPGPGLLLTTDHQVPPSQMCPLKPTPPVPPPSTSHTLTRCPQLRLPASHLPGAQRGLAWCPPGCGVGGFVVREVVCSGLADGDPQSGAWLEPALGAFWAGGGLHVGRGADTEPLREQTGFSLFPGKGRMLSRHSEDEVACLTGTTAPPRGCGGQRCTRSRPCYRVVSLKHAEKRFLDQTCSSCPRDVSFIASLSLAPSEEEATAAPHRAQAWRTRLRGGGCWACSGV